MHPISVFIILIAGVLMVGWTLQAMAQSVIVSVVHAPPLSQGAIITSPLNGSAFTESPITVSGTCPDNSYINLYDNDSFNGAAWCSAGNSWQIVANLSSGNNSLLAQDFNVTDDQGPTTPAVEVSYTPPTPVFESSSLPAGVSPATGFSAPTYPPLVVNTDFNYQVFAVGSNFSWTISVTDGVPPYSLVIVWGDNSSSTIKLATSSSLTIQHKYKTSGYFPVIINITDAKGQKKTVQLAALIAPVGASGVINFNSTGQAPSSPAPAPKLSVKAKKWLWLAWPAYAAVALMLVSYWVGERKEYSKLVKKSRSAA
jgi:hypothetical protein